MNNNKNKTGAASALSLAVQYGQEGDEEPPSRSRVRSLLRAALPGGGDVGVRFVGAKESARYNKTYRGKSGATNVLSFPYQSEGGKVCGDIVVCAPLAEREARRAGMPASGHYAHLIVHAALHLAGHTHDQNADAKKMQSAEREILRRFKITNAPHLQQ